MDLQKHRNVIVYLGATAATFGFGGAARFLGGAFGFEKSDVFRGILSVVACMLWIVTSQKIHYYLTPYCDICRSRPCTVPLCPLCGKFPEPVHAAHAHQDVCSCPAQTPAPPPPPQI